MLKFKRSWAKPKLIRLFFWHLVHGLVAACVAKGAIVAHSNRKTWSNVSAGYIRQKMTLCNSSRNLFKNLAFEIFTRKRIYSLPLITSHLVASNWSQITFFILANVLTSISERFCPKFDKINIPHDSTPFFVGRISNELTCQKSPEGGIWRKELKNGL